MTAEPVHRGHGPRGFLALAFDARDQAKLTSLQVEIPAEGRKTESEQLHLTLLFLGTQPEAAMQALARELPALPAAPFELAVGSVELLQGRSGRRFLRASVELSPPLAVLRKAVVDWAARFVDLPKEGFSFAPHVTLAALPPVPAPEEEGSSLNALAGLPARRILAPPLALSPWAVGLYTSAFRGDAPVYQPLGYHPFAERSDGSAST